MFSKPEGIEDVFENGIKRDPGKLYRQPDGLVLNLGSGNAEMKIASRANSVLNFDRPAWEAPWLDTFPDGTVAAVHMYHFLEHLDPDTARQMLQEVQRVLVPMGVCYICVPHAMCPLAYQAPDHKSYWTEEGFQDTFYSAGYDSAYGVPWEMDISWMMVAGVKWSNICVHVQLVKGEIETPWRRHARSV